MVDQNSIHGNLHILIIIAEMSSLRASMLINCTILKCEEVNISGLRKTLLQLLREYSRYCPGFIYSLGDYLRDFLDLITQRQEKHCKFV